MKSEIPNLRHLRAVREVAECQSISQASTVVHLSQPAITQAIAKIEAQLGVALFDRRAEGMFATEAGAVFLARVVRALDTLQGGAREAMRVGLKKGARGFANFDQLFTVVQLRALIAMSDAGNFTLAARAVGISQPSLHRAARDLERLSGLSLFQKTGQGIALTRSAQVLAQHAKLAFTELEQGFAEIAAARGIDTGRIVVGAMPLPRTFVVPQAITMLTERHPEVAVQVIDGPYDDLLHGLRHGEIDLLVGALRDPVPIDDVEQEVLFFDPLAIVARAGHPLAGRERVTLDDLEAFPWVVPRVGTPTRTHFEAMFSAAEHQPPAGLVETSSLILIRGLLLASDRLTMISAHQIRHERQAGLLTALGYDMAATKRPIGVTTRRGWRPTAVQERFLALLRDAGRAAQSDAVGERPGYSKNE